MRITRPTWVEIDLDNLKNNIEEVVRVIDKGSLVTAVVKADGYGHGALGIIDTLLENGTDRLAVATINEALEIRKKYKEVDIMILGYTPNEFIDELLENNIIQTVFNLDQAIIFNRKAEESGEILKVHIKIDTGMRRLGFEYSDVESVRKIFEFENLDIEGIFTHFATADEKNKEFTIKQFNRFNKLIQNLEEFDIFVPIKHVANSAAIIDMPQFSYDMVRSGIMMYGLNPSSEICSNNVNLRPVMTLKSTISSIKEIEKGEGISYGQIFTANKKMKIGTLPIGYADGYIRSLTGNAEVLIGNKRRKVLGKICMDQCMIDITKLKVEIGDEVILFGGSKKNNLPVDELADKLGTINYEIVCGISRRVPRVYIKDGKIVKVIDNLL